MVETWDYQQRVMAAQQRLSSLGYDTLPLRPGTKKPLAKGWMNCHPGDMWQQAWAASGLGVRCGGALQLTVIDCDERRVPGTWNNVERFLSGLGLPTGVYPLVQTASGAGRHIYCLVSGDFGILPTIDVHDLLPLFQSPPHKPSTDRHAQLALLGRPLPRRAERLLAGEDADYYRSRSEAEAALVTILIKAGHGFDDIMQTFLENPCAGKFQELFDDDPAHAIRWLRRTYDNALEYLIQNATDAGEYARICTAWAASTPWPGRTGTTDRKIYLAHAAICAETGKQIYYASCREMAERSGVGNMTASRATKRLMRAKLVRAAGRPAFEAAIEYVLLPIPQSSASGSDIGEAAAILTHDLFRFRGLGSSAGEVWMVLMREPGRGWRVPELAQETGRSRATVKRALTRMELIINRCTGEVFSIVERQGDTWYALPNADLDRMADLLGTAGAGERQRRKNDHDRWVFQRRVERIKSARQKKDGYRTKR